MSTVPLLTGGILFSLITEIAKKNTVSSNEKLQGKRGEVSDPFIMQELITAILGCPHEFSIASFKKCVSQYKSCKTDGGSVVPLGTTQLKDSFNDTVRNNYPIALSRISKFIDNTIDRQAAGSLVWLTKVIIGTLIQQDQVNSINTVFYVNANGQPMDKSELFHCSNICFDSFLLGILHYIINSDIKNTDGKATYNTWYLTDTSRKPVLRKNTLPSFDKTIEIYFPVNTASCQETSAATSNDDSISNISLEEYTDYLTALKEKISNAKTIIFPTSPKPFYDFYVPSNLVNLGTNDIVNGNEPRNIFDISKKLIISGKTGLGKSSFLKHIIFDVIENPQNYHRIPILVQLKNYDPNTDNLLKLSWFWFNAYRPINPKDFLVMLKSGKFIILLDGIDEIKAEFLNDFKKDLEKFTAAFSKNWFVLSSRPFSSFIGLEEFTELQIAEFTLEQSMLLIHKLTAFLDSKIYEGLFIRLLPHYGTLASNPLLLTISFFNFAKGRNSEAKFIALFDGIWESITQKFTINKINYIHNLNTNLTPEQFKSGLSKLCARVFFKKDYTFTKSQLKSYYKTYFLSAIELVQKPSFDNFLNDIVNNLGILYRENDKYYFTHSSYIEYFSACYCAELSPQDLSVVVEKLNGNLTTGEGLYFVNVITTGLFFPMLYDLAPEKLEKYIYLPMIENLLVKCSNNEDYLTYLHDMYNIFVYKTGKIEFESDLDFDSSAIPRNHIYYYFLQRNGIDAFMDDVELPFDPRLAFIKRTISNEYQCIKGLTYNFFPRKPDKFVPYFDPSEEALGYVSAISFPYLLEHREEFPEILLQITSDEFPLKQEYYNIQMKYEELIEKYRPKDESIDSIFE